MLTQDEKKILRKANQGKSDAELDAIGASDKLARAEIEAFKIQQWKILPLQINSMRRNIEVMQIELDKYLELHKLIGDEPVVEEPTKTEE